MKLSAIGRSREIIFALAFLGMALYEAFEIWMFELPMASPISLKVLVHALQIGLILGVTWVLIRAWREKTAREEALARLVERITCAQEEERRRIACDLHDGIAQLVVSAKHHLDTCAELWRRDRDRAREELGKGIDRLQRTIVDTRRVLMALRPSAIDSVGLVPALRGAVTEAAQERGWVATFSESLGGLRLPAAVETAIFRITQEALANASRHSGTASIDVDLRREPGWVVLDVRDRGTGFLVEDAAAGRGLGLYSMRERARLLGGSCAIESTAERGTRVSVRLPTAGGADAHTGVG